NGARDQMWLFNLSADPTRDTIRNAAYGLCLDGFLSQQCLSIPDPDNPLGPGWNVCYPQNPDAYVDTCRGGDGNEQLYQGLWGANPLQYIPFTIHAYGFVNLPYVLDVHYNGRVNGIPVDIAPQNGSTAQTWWYDDSTHEIHLAVSNNMCLDKPAGQNANGTRLQIWTCNGSRNQEWYPGSGMQWMNGESGKCLDTPLGNFSNPYVRVWTCNGGINQDWVGPEVQA